MRFSLGQLVVSPLLIGVFASGCAVSSMSRTAADSPHLQPERIRAVMKRVADWQLVNPSSSRHRYTEDRWTWGAFYTGLMAWSKIADDSKYHEAMLAMGKRFAWQPADRIYHADDHCVSQTYLELYLQHRDPAMLTPTKARMDYLLTNPSTNSLQFNIKGALDRWSWCDSLFMSPPALARLYTATGERRYLDYLTREWWITTDYLYDREEHLYFRDSNYFERREANGKKVFWSRGNGWVLAGLARVLQHLPRDHSDRPRFEQLFRDMAHQVLSCQQPDGLWRASLLDPASYPLQETSGSGFFVFAFAWGVNNGLLERNTFEPAIRRGWSALVECVNPDGKLTHVQPVGADPKSFAPDSSDVFGVGAFLLAGSEVYQLARK